MKKEKVIKCVRGKKEESRGPKGTKGHCNSPFCFEWAKELENKIMNREEACKKMYNLVQLELGVKETLGSKATARIIEYHKHTTLKATSDEVPWCSAFANFITDTAGFPGTHSAAAISWKKWGVLLDKPISGCLVLISRKDPSNPMAAHIAFCDHPDISKGMIRCIGGNQGDAVKVSSFSVSKVLAYIVPF